MADAYQLVLTEQFVKDEARFASNQRALKDLAKTRAKLSRDGLKAFKETHRVRSSDAWTVYSGEGRRLLVRANGRVLELLRFDEHDDAYQRESRASSIAATPLPTGAPADHMVCTTLSDEILGAVGVPPQFLGRVRACRSHAELDLLAPSLGDDTVLYLELFDEQAPLEVLTAIATERGVSSERECVVAGADAVVGARDDTAPAVGVSEVGAVTTGPTEEHPTPHPDQDVPPAADDRDDSLPGSNAGLSELISMQQEQFAAISERLPAVDTDQRSAPQVAEPVALPVETSTTDATEPEGSQTPDIPTSEVGPFPGSTWNGGRGEQKWLIRGSRRTMTRVTDGLALANLVGDAPARAFIARALELRPGGGRVWVDNDGNAVTTVEGRDLYLGRIGVAGRGQGSAAAPEDLAGAIRESLRTAPGSTVREVLFALGGGAFAAATKREVNSLLYRMTDTFTTDASHGAPRWSLKVGSSGATTDEAGPRRTATPPRARRRESSRGTFAHLLGEAPRSVAPPPVRLDRAGRSAPARVLQLFAWQEEAVASWYAQACHGIVEAVTGTGKTIVGLEVVAHAVRAGERATVLVPSVDLQDQWVARFAAFLPDLAVARLGGKAQGRPETSDVTIAVVNSALKTDLSRLSHDSLLVADEVHRYGSEQFQHALRAGYGRRLGLTATLERSDDAVEHVLRPYFSGTVATVGFDRAIRDQVVAPFRLVMAPVALTDEEQELYDRLSRQISNGLRVLKSAGALGNGSGSLSEKLGRLRGAGGQIGAAARQAESGMRSRRQLLAAMEGKLDAIEELAEIVDRSQGTVLFTQTSDTADAAAQRLREWGVSASALHGDMAVSERRAALSGLADGRIQALAAPKLLDEGIDVPTVDLGVVMTASRSRRQMVQRLGRIIRRKADGRPVDFVVLYAPDTVEDPESGVHEGFFDLVGDVATRKLQLEPGWSAQQIRA